MGKMKYQKVVILVAVFLFIVPFVFAQECTPSNTGDVREDKEICAYTDTEFESGNPTWKSVDNPEKVYKVVFNDDVFDVLYDISDEVWYGCDAEDDSSYWNEKINLDKISITTGNPEQTHEYICHKDSTGERWGECHGTQILSNTGGIGYDVGKRIEDIPSYYYCTNPTTDSFVWATEISDKTTCDAAGNPQNMYGEIAWTGSRCCGDRIGEYYSDSTAGCWNGRKLDHGILVSDIELIYNGGFEEDSNGDNWPDYWTYIGDGNGVWSSNVVKDGFKSFHFNTLSDTTKLYGIRSSAISVRPNTWYKYSVFVKVPNLQTGYVRAYPSCYGDWHSESEEPITYNTFIWGTQQASKGEVSEQWEELYGNFRTLANTKHCHLVLYLTQNADGWVWFDNAQMSETNNYILNYNGFKGCTVSSQEYGLPPNLITLASYCAIYNTPNKRYFCSYGKNGWSSMRDDLDNKDDGNPTDEFRTNPSTFPANLLINPLFR